MIQGSAEQVMGWVKERRVSDKDELKRLGWVIYEKDEAWAIISAFPELSGPSAHAILRAIRKQNLWILSGAVAFGLLGFILISFNFLMPAYDASKRVEASIDAERRAAVRAQEAVASKEKSDEAAKSALAEAERQKGLALMAEANLSAQVRQTRSARAEVSGLEARLEAIKTTMPVVVRWRDSLINADKVVVISNASGADLRLLVSIYDASGSQTKKQFSVTLASAGLAGSTKESGIGESIKHYFQKGESIEITDVDARKDFRFRSVRSNSP